MPRGKKTIHAPIQAEPAWKNNFKASTIKAGFCLALSRPMLEMLCAVADDVQWDRSTYGWNLHRPDNWIAAQTALERRGLVERKSKEEVYAQIDAKEEWGEWSHYRLTPAGERVVELVKLTGMFIEADAAIIKKSRQAARRA